MNLLSELIFLREISGNTIDNTIEAFFWSDATQFYSFLENCLDID